MGVKHKSMIVYRSRDYSVTLIGKIITIDSEVGSKQYHISALSS